MERILTERRGHILVVTINRPEAKNAFDSVSAQAIHAAMDLLDAEDDLFVGVITGAGGVFSAGADLKAVVRGERAVTARGGFGMFSRPSRKPLIAAVEGYAVGGGLELCLSCDLIVAARDAKMGLPEVRHNVSLSTAAGSDCPGASPITSPWSLRLAARFRTRNSFTPRSGQPHHRARPGARRRA